jgi:hypothetical protein
MWVAVACIFATVLCAVFVKDTKPIKVESNNEASAIS